MSTFDRLVKTLVGSKELTQEEKAEPLCDHSAEIQVLKERIEDLERRLRSIDLEKSREKRLIRMGLGRKDKK